MSSARPGYRGLRAGHTIERVSWTRWARTPGSLLSLQTIAAALMKGATVQVRGGQADKNARDGYVSEHVGGSGSFSPIVLRALLVPSQRFRWTVLYFKNKKRSYNLIVEGGVCVGEVA